MSRTITVAEFAEKGAPKGYQAYLETWQGPQLVGHIYYPDGGPWAHCPRENAGFGLSYAVCATDTLMLVPTGEEG